MLSIRDFRQILSSVWCGQEEMCRQHHEAHGTRILVLRPDYIVDAAHGADD